MLIRLTCILLLVSAGASSGQTSGLPKGTATNNTPKSSTTKPAESKSKTATDQGPNLVDTLDFIRQTLASYGRVVHTISGSWGSTITTNLYFLDSADGCNVVFKETQSTTGFNARAYDTTDLTWSLNLSSLDPKSVSFSDNSDGSKHVGFTLELRTTNNHASIVQDYGPDHTERASFVLAIYDQEMTERVAKAISHAILLCGGKPSSF